MSRNWEVETYCIHWQIFHVFKMKNLVHLARLHLWMHVQVSLRNSYVLGQISDTLLYTVNWIHHGCLAVMFSSAYVNSGLSKPS